MMLRLPLILNRNLPSNRKAVSAAKSCAALKLPPIAAYSVKSARRKIRLGRVWYHRKGAVRLITCMEMIVEDKILLAHGSGGKLAHDLITKNFVSALDNPLLAQMDDSAVFDVKHRLAFTTDSYVVNPIFFPGGNIGKLAVCGTVNDLAMSGARPLYLSLASHHRRRSAAERLETGD